MTEFRPIVPVQRSGLVAMKDVVFAIFLRELKTRFGDYRLGYIWAVAEPLSFVVILGYIRSFASEGEVYTIPPYVFFALGYMTYQLFAKSLSQCSGAIQGNRGLFAYRQVKPIDAVLARVILELIVYAGTLLVLMMIFVWMGISLSISDPLLGVAAVGCVLILALGAGLGVIALIVRIKEVEKLVAIINRPLFFLSGLFFSINDIPQQYQAYLLLNPLLHANELVRHSLYGFYPIPGVSLTYLSLWALAIFTLGLAAYRISWSRMVAS